MKASRLLHGELLGLGSDATNVLNVMVNRLPHAALGIGLHDQNRKEA